MSTVNLFEYKSGLPVDPELSSFALSVEGNELLLHEAKAKFGKPEIRQTYRIPLENVVDLNIVTEKEMKDKSVIGRGVLGAVLLGSTGAILGGMSGVGKKEKSFYALVISYLSPNTPNELKNIVLDAEFAGWLGKNQSQVKQIRKQWETVPPSTYVRGYLSASGLEKNADGSITL